MSKYTGQYLMDDTGIKEHQIISGKIEVKLEKLLGPGSFSSDIGVDNRRLLKWAYVTDGDETPAKETVVIDPNLIDDPATSEIQDHAKLDDKERKSKGEVEGAHLGSQAEQDEILRAQQ